MIKRSYSKQKEFLFNKDVIPPYGVGTYFSDYYKTTENEHFVKLSRTGKQLIQRFKTENSTRENLLKEKEQQLYDYKHSKPPLEINPWLPFIKRKIKTRAHEDDLLYKKELARTESSDNKKDNDNIINLNTDNNELKDKDKPKKMSHNIRIEKDCEGEFSIPRADEIHSFSVHKPKKVSYTRSISHSQKRRRLLL
jgi:hypothetical protein